MKKLYLEFIRGAAAICVLAYHSIELHQISHNAKKFSFSSWGTDAVMMFFILSGIVINISQTRNPKSRPGFLGNRLLRLYPQLIAGLVLGLLVLTIVGAEMPTFWETAGNFFMLSAEKAHMNNIVPSIVSNSPVWSLSYEMFFYIAFAVTIGRYQKKAMLAWFVLAILIFPLYYSGIAVNALGHILGMMAFSSVWLVGYYVYEYRHYFYADKYTALFSVGTLPLISRMHITGIYYDPAKYLLFAIFAIPFFRYCLQIPAEGKKIKLHYVGIPFIAIIVTVYMQPYITDINWMLYSMLPISFVAACMVIHLFRLKTQTVSAINGIGRVLGKYSYSIYISHYPILFLCAAFIHNTALYLLVSFPCIFLIAYSLETWLQPLVTGLFKRTKAPYMPSHTWIVNDRLAKA